MKYRKKPVVIDAIQWTGDNPVEIVNFVRPSPCLEFDGDDDLLIDTLEGQMRAVPNDWIIKGVKGELYPCKPDIFEETYEPAN